MNTHKSSIMRKSVRQIQNLVMEAILLVESLLNVSKMQQHVQSSTKYHQYSLTYTMKKPAPASISSQMPPSNAMMTKYLMSLTNLSKILSVSHLLKELQSTCMMKPVNQLQNPATVVIQLVMKTKPKVH